MKSRSLGRTDLRLSEITQGTWGLASGAYGPVRAERFDQTLRAALDAGVTAFDCAPVWGDGEERVGRLLEEAKSDALVITRGGARRVDGKLQQSFDKDALIRDCDASLARLGRETIDLWLLHNPGDATIRAGEWRSAIDQLELDGKIRAWGMSVGDAEEARLAIDAGAQAICLHHNLLAQSDLTDLGTDLAARGCGVLVRSPLMYGLLAGRWSEGRRFTADDHRANRWSRSAFEERIGDVEELRFLVGPDHSDLATAAIRFVLTHAAVTTAIVGARNSHQIGAAVEAASGPPYLSADDMARLTKIRGAAGS
jgi:aryl-alcohol dehydrogenase-like predicted oxidoreductase